MRSSTILVISLRALAQETIKNLVLSGVGRMIVMDDKEVTEMDLGAGLLFREDEGGVGQKVGHTLPPSNRMPLQRHNRLTRDDDHSRPRLRLVVASRSGPPADPVPQPARQDRPSTDSPAFPRRRLGYRD